jgi:hypothetical protein
MDAVAGLPRGFPQAETAQDTHPLIFLTWEPIFFKRESSRLEYAPISITACLAVENASRARNVRTPLKPTINMA